LAAPGTAAGGKAISLTCVGDGVFLRNIEKVLKRSIARKRVPGFEPLANVEPKPGVLGRMPLGIGGARMGGGGGRRAGRVAGAEAARRSGATPGACGAHSGGEQHPSGVEP
jgi:hypothetical protein